MLVPVMFDQPGRAQQGVCGRRRRSCKGATGVGDEDIDNWCGTGWPHHVPKPKGGEPDPSPWQVFLGAAVAATELAHGLDGKDAEHVGAAAQKLFEQAQHFSG